MRSEALPTRWLRRAVSVPVYVLLAASMHLLLPLWLPLALVVDLVSDRRRLPRVRMLAFFLLYLSLEVAGVVVATGAWLKHLLRRDPAAFLEDNAALQRWWTGRLFDGAAATLGFRVVVEAGAQAVLPAPFLLLVRHSSTADTVLAAALVANPHHVLLRYVLKRELLWDPCLDIVGQRLPNTFVDRSGARREAEIAAVAALGRGLDARSAALIYPEGTRFSPAKLAAAEARLAGRPELASFVGRFHHVLPPRLGGPLALLDAAPGVDLLLLEHAGFEPAASFGELWRGGLVGRVVRARFRRVPAAEVPSTGREAWLMGLWLETDRWVGEAQARIGARERQEGSR